MTIMTVSNEEAIGESRAFLTFQEQISAIAKVNRPVLLIGERGTGKEMAAKRIHYLSERWNAPFATLNCATLAPSLLETELFGHEAGAFTGANKQRSGRFESANGGTFFLDEIGQMPLEVQEKVLRVVEYGVFERVGSTKPIEVDVRIIGATNANLPQMCEVGEFKPDLLDRLTFEVLTLPPLRYRQEDILLLAKTFATRMAMEMGLPKSPEFSKNASQSLLEHDWPGNIRELKNVVERAVYQNAENRDRLFIIKYLTFDPFASPYTTASCQTEGNTVTESNSEVPSGISTHLNHLSLTEAVQEFEVQRLQQSLHEAQYHQGHAAEQLGLSYNQFRRLYKKYKNRLTLKSGNSQKDQKP